MTATLPQSTRNFYIVGGTMRHDAPSYVERHADKELFSVLLQQEFCHVLTARQMGKSSLMLRTAARLRDAGLGVAILDLTAIGQNLTPEQWYSGLVLQLGERLNLEDDLFEFWVGHTHLGPMQRWVEALRKVVLPKTIGQLVIFIDEIDAVRSLNFSTDEFFAGIRECYNLRTVDEDLQRLTFCLIGVAIPSDLIRDTRTTPFNIGTRIELHDFTQVEALSLADGLRWAREQNRTILKRILHWTAGHPYLTQRVCQAVIENETIRKPADVDTLIDELFFSKRAHEYDDNLIFVRERLLRSGADLTALLNLYAKVRRGKAVQDVDSDPLVPILRLSGVTRGAQGLLRVRNRIYERVFDTGWVKANLPDFEIRRQREAYRRGVWRTTLVSAMILFVVVSLAVMAFWQRNMARHQAKINGRLLYTTQMKLINQEWENANVSRVEELLEATTPQPGDEDLRGFEWQLFYKETHKEIFRLENLDNVISAKFLNDQAILAIGAGGRSRLSSGRAYTVKLYNWKTGTEIISFNADTYTGTNLIAFSPDAKYVATNLSDRTITLWNVASGIHLTDLNIHQQAAVQTAAFAPGKELLACGDGAGMLTIWNFASSPQPELTKKVGETINSLAFSPDGHLLAMTTKTMTVQLFDLRAKKMLQPFSIKDGILDRPFFSPDSKLLAVTTEGGNLHLWDIASRQLLPFTPSHSKEIYSLAFTPDGKVLATGSVDRIVKLWDMTTGTPISFAASLIRGHGSDVNSLNWSADGKLLLTGASDGTVKIWDVFAKTPPLLPQQKVISYSATVFSPDSELIALGTTDESQAKLWNLSSGQDIADLGLIPKGEKILVAVFSEDAQMVAVSYSNNLVEIYEVNTGKRLKRLPNIETPIKGLTFSPDGKTLVTGGNQADLKLWDLSDAREPELLNSGNTYYRTAFSPDGQYLASADGDGTLHLWEFASRRMIKTFRGHTGMIRSLAFSPNGRLLASGSDDLSVRLWDITSGNSIAHPAQANIIYRIAFTPDSKRVITGSSDGSIVLWDTTDMQEVLTLKGFTKQVSSLTFSDNGTSFAASSEDGNVKIWQAEKRDEG
jgi:WD40 repeat protein